MTLTARHERLSLFIQRHRPLWEEEVIAQYPRDGEIYPDSWIAQAAACSDSELKELEHGRPVPALRGELAQYFAEAAELSQLPAAEPAAIALPRMLLDGVKGKKRHEIAALCVLVRDTCRRAGVREVIDHCGGAGYLAQALCAHCGLSVLTVDNDTALQETGLTRARRLGGRLSEHLRYLHDDLAAPRALPDGAFFERSLSLGLHTCGSLAEEQLRLAVENGSRAVINIGCCYYKGGPAPSLLASWPADRVQLNPEGATLAAHAPASDAPSYSFSKQVKRYRYTFHLFLYHELGIRRFCTLGSSPKRLYSAPFAVYAAEQLERLGVCAAEALRLEQFFSSPAIAARVERMMYANIIRAALARPLELYILSDRALYLEQNGYAVSLSECFNRALSPRNVAMVGLHGGN